MADNYIIIPVHNRKHFTKPCLDSLKKQTIKNFITIVVDDGSTDGTSEMIENNFPRVTVLKGNGNYWWTKSVNIGIDYAISKNAETVILFNDDLIVDPDCLKNLFDAHEKYPDSLLGCMGYSISSKNAYVQQKPLKIKWILGKYMAMKCDEKSVCETMLLPGRGLFIPINIIKKIGKFDEKSFPQCGADYDFVLRGKKAGYKAYVCNKAIIRFHSNESAAEKLKTNKNIKNFILYISSFRSSCNLIFRIRFSLKHCPWYYLPFNIFFEFVRIIYSYWFK